jgi:adenylate kinase
MQQNIYLLGAPGAGKGTQAQLLSEKLGIPQLSTGEMLRSARLEGSELGSRVAAIMDSGKLVSDSIVIELVEHRLARPDHQNGVILDGFPRTIPQAEALDALFARTGRSALKVIAVDVPNDEIRRRLQGRRWCTRCKKTYHVTDNPPGATCEAGGACQLEVRTDDKPEAVEKRLQTYAEQTAPLLAYYQAKGTFFSVNGTGKIGDIFSAVMACISA